MVAEIQRLASRYPEVERVNEVLTMHVGPDYILAAVSLNIACDVPRGDGSDGTFNPDQWVDPKDQRKIDDFIVYAITAAQQAVTDSGYEAKT